MFPKLNKTCAIITFFLLFDLIQGRVIVDHGRPYVDKRPYKFQRYQLEAHPESTYGATGPPDPTPAAPCPNPIPCVASDSSCTYVAGLPCAPSQLVLSFDEFGGVRIAFSPPVPHADKCPEPVASINGYYVEFSMREEFSPELTDTLPLADWLPPPPTRDRVTGSIGNYSIIPGVDYFVRVSTRSAAGCGAPTIEGPVTKPLPLGIKAAEAAVRVSLLLDPSHFSDALQKLGSLEEVVASTGRAVAAALQIASARVRCVSLVAALPNHVTCDLLPSPSSMSGGGHSRPRPDGGASASASASSRTALQSAEQLRVYVKRHELTLDPSSQSQHISLAATMEAVVVLRTCDDGSLAADCGGTTPTSKRKSSLFEWIKEHPFATFLLFMIAAFAAGYAHRSLNEQDGAGQRALSSRGAGPFMPVSDGADGDDDDRRPRRASDSGDIAMDTFRVSSSARGGGSNSSSSSFRSRDADMEEGEAGVGADPSEFEEIQDAVTHGGRSARHSSKRSGDRKKQQQRSSSSRPDSSDASMAADLLKQVLSDLGIPAYASGKYARCLADHNLTTVEQLRALDNNDWKRVGLPIVVEQALRKALLAAIQHDAKASISSTASAPAAAAASGPSQPPQPVAAAPAPARTLRRSGSSGSSSSSSSSLSGTSPTPLLPPPPGDVPTTARRSKPRLAVSALPAEEPSLAAASADPFASMLDAPSSASDSTSPDPSPPPSAAAVVSPVIDLLTPAPLVATAPADPTEPSEKPLEKNKSGPAPTPRAPAKAESEWLDLDFDEFDP